MTLRDWIVERAADVELTGADSKSAIAELAAAAERAGATLPAGAVNELLKRERLRSTGIGGGIALPHALVDGLDRPRLLAGRSARGIKFAAVDGKPVHVVLALLWPADAPAAGLQFLWHLIRRLRGEKLAAQLLTARSADETLAALAQVDTSAFSPQARPPRVCVVGAGSGGLAMAAHLALLGRSVKLFNRSPARIEPVRHMGGIQASGQISGFAAIETITTDPAEAVADADLVMVVLPATGHREIAQRLAPHLHDGQVVLLNPGRAGGALEFLHVLRETGTHARPLVAEAQTLLYSCRDINPGSVHVFGVKNAVPLAAVPAFMTPDVLALVNRCLPQFAACDNVFKTSLDNIGFVFHPALTVLNAAWIEERHGDFEYYREGASPSVARCLEALDQERVSVATALGVGGTSARQWLYMAYGATGKDLYEAIQANPGYQGIKAPNRLAHRYVSEDVPMSLVPIASLGEHLGLNMTTTRAIIHLASLALQTDYWAQGRTVQRLGVDRLSGPQIVRRAVEGDWPG